MSPILGWRSCVEEQCECFNVRGHALQDSACGMIFIKTCVRAFGTCCSRIACIPFSGSETGERVIPGSCHLIHRERDVFREAGCSGD
ncbi:hypothetical protein CEXT_70191 [Caerostris extrusa]|uniref:Uncharacterized protein n=1 Tax=Caerostris extrusa TaxID=172846 RepID=A0AAV4X572_CAEEX|nr:hypothetical protein CEXT_70191 [Caerostris extrusa]